MDRKDFLNIAVQRKPATTASLKNKQAAAATGLTPYTGAWTLNEVTHLLKRTMFGAKKIDIDYFLTRTMQQAVDELINTSTVPSPPLRDYGLIVDDDGMTYDDLGVPLGQTWINDNNTLSNILARGGINKNRVDSLLKWWVGLMVNQQRSIQEKMVLFWHHHFSIQREEVELSAVLYKHHKLLRDNAMGDVKKLTREVCIDPAMLIHLNGFLNSKQAPDENFARELQELFVIGKGDDSQYTENDVIAAARVLTGWRYETLPAVKTVFDSGAHDTNSKTFSAFYNNTVIAGSSDGYTELDALTDMLFANTEASKFICRKLYKWFVYYDIDAVTETNVIAPLAKLLRDSNYQVKPVLLALFKSEHFFDTANQACYIKTPYDLVAGTLREFNALIPAYTDYVNGYPLFDKIYQNAAFMQQDLFQPPDVSGWPAYTQEPMNYELWVNSNSLPRHANFTNDLVKDNVIDVKAFAGYSTNPADPNQLVLDVTKLLLRYPLSDASRAYVKTKFLLNNTTTDSVWTNAWNTNNVTVIDTSLKAMFTFLLNLPEFHLC
jgi:uncharacterized protein (DUF1800 family)